MDQTKIFAPFVGVLLLTLVVWLYMYARRLPFILSSKLAPHQLTPVEFARLSPPQVANPSDNLKNLFELPTLFYATVLIVHCTFNFVPLRFWLYATSAFALWFMILRIALAAFS